MYSLLPLLTGLFTGEIRETIARKKLQFVYMAVMGLFAVIAAIFLMVAATLWLAQRYGALVACLTMAGAFATVCLLVWIVWKISDARLRRRAVARRQAQSPARLAAGLVVARNLASTRSAGMLAVPLAVFGAAALYYAFKPAGEDGESDE